MEKEPDEKRRQEVLKHVVVALESMRDALVACAMMLRDYQFHTDLTMRRAAAEQANALIDRVRDRQAANRPD